MKSLKSKICAALILAMTFNMCGCAFLEKEEEEITPAVNTTSTIGEVGTNTLKLNMNGSVTEISCEDFASAGIATDGLEKHVKSEIEGYNTERGASKITLVEYKEDGVIVTTAIQYSDIDTYNEFNNTDIFMSLYSIKEADRLATEDAEKHKKVEEFVIDNTTDLSEISEEELAAAGYTLEDVLAMQSEQQGETGSAGDASETDAVAATFTDASGNETVSEDIEQGQYMMLTTKADVNIVINGGEILYVNHYAKIINETTADLSGDGVAVVIYKYNY